MSFPADLTATLTGTTPKQLYSWRRHDLLVPEISSGNPPLYSFRDLVAVRTVSFLRARMSLQKIRQAFTTLREFDYTDHPSTYRFGTDGKTIAVADADGVVVDLLKNKGQLYLFTMEEVFREFTNLQNETVVDFEHPRPRLQVTPGRMGGWPTIEGTRVTFDTVAGLVDGDSIRPEDVEYYYPSVSAEAAQDALSFAKQVSSVGRKKAS